LLIVIVIVIVMIIMMMVAIDRWEQDDLNNGVIVEVAEGG